jgi:hypothetical protein
MQLLITRILSEGSGRHCLSLIPPAKKKKKKKRTTMTMTTIAKTMMKTKATMMIIL